MINLNVRLHGTFTKTQKNVDGSFGLRCVHEKNINFLRSTRSTFNYFSVGSAYFGSLKIFVYSASKNEFPKVEASLDSMPIKNCT